MRKAIKSLFVIILSLVPSILFGETSQKTNSVHTCPDNVKSALIGIDNGLIQKKWINIDLDACPHIQAEIIKDVDKVLDSSEFGKYFALMNQKTMRIVRNAFFARRGHKFDDTDLQRHFMNYAWYKPIEKAQIVLTSDEKYRVNLLKSIEDKWLVKEYPNDWDNPPRPLLPIGVEIIDKGDKSSLKFKGKTLDVSPKPYSVDSSIRNFFTIHSNVSRQTILVCSHSRKVDSKFLNEMKLYAADGKLMFSFENNDSSKADWINGLFRCPDWTSQSSNILVSYNNAGCCGATWDILTTFDDKLKPITVLNCGEQVCGGTSYFRDVNEGAVYISVAAEGSFENQGKSAIKYINYHGSSSASTGKKHFRTWSLWSIDNKGNLNLLAQESEKYHDEPVTSGSWYEIIDVPYPAVDLMAYSDRHGSSPKGEILTSIKLGKTLIVFRVDDQHYATTIIPVQY